MRRRIETLFTTADDDFDDFDVISHNDDKTQVTK